MDFIRLIAAARERWPRVEGLATTDNPRFVRLVEEAQLLVLAGHSIPALENFFLFEGNVVSRDLRNPFAVINDLKRQIQEAHNAA